MVYQRSAGTSCGRGSGWVPRARSEDDGEKQSGVGTLRSECRVCCGKIFKRQSPRTFENVLPRTRPKLVNASVRDGPRGGAHRTAWKNRPDFDWTINE